MEKAKGIAALIFVTILAVVLGVYSYRLVMYVHHNWAHIVATAITIAEWAGGIAFILILAALKGNGSSSEKSDSEPQASPKSNFKPSLQLHSVQVLIPGSVKYTTRRSQS